MKNTYKVSKGIILSGFCRNTKEADFVIKFAQKNNIKIKALIQVNISFETSLDNLHSRLICKNCGETYEKGLKGMSIRRCINCDYPLEKYLLNNNDAREDYYEYFHNAESIFEILSSVSESSFSVSAGQDISNVIASIFEKIKYGEKNHYALYERKSDAIVETKYGKFKILTYLSKIDYSYHLALVKGNVKKKEGVILRVHSSCMTGDIFGSMKCDCGDQLHKAMSIIQERKQGIIIYLSHEGRGINIVNKIRAYNLQNRGADTAEANEMLGFPIEMREYDAVRDILKDLGVRSVRLLTNNPEKIKELEEMGIVIESRLSLEVKNSKYNKKYLATKKSKMNHILKKIH